MTKYYGRNISIKKTKMESIMPESIELPPSERLFGFPVKKYSKRLNSTENRVLCLTGTNLYVCDGATVLSKHPLESILCVSIFEEDPNKFQISYTNSTKSSPSIFYCDERDTIISNLMNICGSNNPDGPVYDLSGTHVEYIIPPSCLSSPDLDIEEYFLKKLAKLGVASGEQLIYALKEFLINIPQSYPMQVKDRRGMTHQFEILQYLNERFEKGNTKCVSTMIDVLLVIQRLLSARTNYAEVKNVKGVTQIFGDLLRSEDNRIVSAGALTLLRIIELPKQFSPKETKLEAMNKAFFLSTEDKTSPILNALLSTLLQRAGESVNERGNHTLVISCLLDILVSQLSTHSNTTAPNWFKEITPKMSRGRVLITLFELARSPCFAIALKTATVLKVILNQIAPDQFPQIQDSARQQLSLLYQIFQAVDSRLKIQRNESAQLVGLMAEGNNESMKLISRIFPSGLMRILETPQVEKKKQSRNPLKRSTASNTQSESRIKLNWVEFFKAIGRDERKPTLLWNTDTRNEVIKAISDEIDRYEREKENNQETNKIWNHEEFSVDYETLNKELIIFDTYLGVILEQPDQLQLSKPSSYLYQCFHKLIMEENEDNRIRYLNVMSWCYRNYPEKIGYVSCYPNLIQLLSNYISNKQINTAGALLEFILSSFKDQRNVRTFINLNGVATAAELLEYTHCTGCSGTTIVCLNVLLTACRHVSSTDERGCIKIPIPQAKRELSNAISLTRLAYTLIGSTDLVIDFTARLLTEVLDKNSGKAKTLHKKTGILYFIFAYQNTSAGPSLMKLLQTIASQQDPHLLRKFIPDSVASYMESVDSDEFANVFYCLSSSPEIIWTTTMRDILQNKVISHIQGFVEELNSNPHATYTFSEMETIEYPGLDEELRCGNYYVRNIIENPEWNIENVEEVLSDALDLVHTVERQDQVVLIRACSVLFKKKRYRRKQTIKNFEGFPLILRLVDLDRNNPDLSQENIELLNVCCELIFFSVWTSDENLTNFLKLKGLSRLCNLLWCCSRNIQSCYSILFFVLKIVCRLLPSPITRDQVALNTDVIRDILSCLIVGQPFEIVSLAMQSLIELSQENRLAEAVFKKGGHYYLLDFVLSYNPSAEQGTEGEKLNQLAVSACLVLGNISGIYKGQNEALTSTEEKFQKTLEQLLTKGNLQRMRSESEFKFVTGLSQTYESPVSIWNESTRNELAQFIRDRIQLHQHSHQEEPDELLFSFSAHKQEIQVDGIFLRYYIQNPQWRLQNARSFVSKLLIEIENVISNPSNLKLVLQSLYFVLTETQGLEKLIVTSEALDQFFSILSTYDEELQSLILSIFLHVTANQSCVDSICASDRLPQFVSFLYKGALEQKRILLEVISNMVSCSARAVEGITTSGLILYLLNYIVQPDDEQLCAQALGVLKQTKSSSGLDTRFIDSTKLFLPLYLITLFDKPANFLHVYNSNVSSPNLIWNDICRSAVKQHINGALSTFQSNSSKEWNSSSVSGIDFSSLNQQILIGGVYIDLYLQIPQTRLHNPSLFIESCFEKFNSSSDGNIQGKLLCCLSNLLTYHSPWAHYIGKIITPQSLQTLLSFFSNTTIEQESKAALLKVIAILSHVPSCRKKFHQTSILSQLLSSIETYPVFEELVMRCCYLLVKKETAFIKQILDCDGLPIILKVRDKNEKASKFAHALIKSMIVDRKYDSQVRQQLAGRENLLQDKSKLPQPEWVQVGKLTPAIQSVYIEPVEAGARAQQLASLQRSSTAVQLQVPSSTTNIPTTTNTPAQIAPLTRATTQPQINTNLGGNVSTPPQTRIIQEEPISLTKQTPIPPSKPEELRPPEALAPVPISDAGPPPPPPAVMAPPPPLSSTIPKNISSGGRGALLDSIVKGTTLKKAKIPTEEEKRAQRIADPARPAGDNLMDALAGALAARRTAMVTNLAANPFADDKDDDEEDDEWE